MLELISHLRHQLLEEHVETVVQPTRLIREQPGVDFSSLVILLLAQLIDGSSNALRAPAFLPTLGPESLPVSMALVNLKNHMKYLTESKEARPGGWPHMLAAGSPQPQRARGRPSTTQIHRAHPPKIQDTHEL